MSINPEVTAKVAEKVIEETANVIETEIEKDPKNTIELIKVIARYLLIGVIIFLTFFKNNSDNISMEKQNQILNLIHTDNQKIIEQNDKIIFYLSNK